MFQRFRPAPVPSGNPDPRLGRLHALFAWAGVTVLDVGARGGALPWMRRLAPYAHYVACEPQADADTPTACENIWRKRTVVREALASAPGTLRLNVAANGGFTSSLAPDQDMAARFCLAAEMAPAGQIQVPALTLAEAAARYGFEDVGFVKLDTQGSELEILQSGEALLAGPVQAVFIECEFRRFYRDQPLFADIDAWLRGRGFDIIGLEPTSRRRRTAASPAYSKPEIAWAHALYVKNLPAAAQADAEAALRAAARQIMVAAAYEYFDLAAERLEDPHVQGWLAAAGLAASAEDVRAFVAAAVLPAARRAMRNGTPDVVRHRTPLYGSEP